MTQRQLQKRLDEVEQELAGLLQTGNIQSQPFEVKKQVAYLFVERNLIENCKGYGEGLLLILGWLYAISLSIPLLFLGFPSPFNVIGCVLNFLVIGLLYTQARELIGSLDKQRVYVWVVSPWGGTLNQWYAHERQVKRQIRWCLFLLGAWWVFYLQIQIWNSILWMALSVFAMLYSLWIPYRKCQFKLTQTSYTQLKSLLIWQSNAPSSQQLEEVLTVSKS